MAEYTVGSVTRGESRFNGWWTKGSELANGFYTKHYQYWLPNPTRQYKVGDFNYNWNLLDADLTNIQIQLNALRGALVYLGTINATTTSLVNDSNRNTRLTTRAKEILLARANALPTDEERNESPKEPMKTHVLVDNQLNDWWFDGTNWVNIGYTDFATQDNMGTVQGTTKPWQVNIRAISDPGELYASAGNEMYVRNLTEASGTGALYSTTVGQNPTWGVLPILWGGTGRNNIPAYTMYYATANDVLGNTSPNSDANTVLKTTSANNVPVWEKVSLATDVSDTLPVSNGGTGRNNIPAYTMYYATSANVLGNTSPNSDANTVLKTTSANNTPVWGKVSLTTDVSGTLPVANGGTGRNTLTTNYLLYGQSTNPVGMLAPSAGYLKWTGSSFTWDTPPVGGGDTFIYEVEGTPVLTVYPLNLTINGVTKSYNPRSGTANMNFTIETGGGDTIVVPGEPLTVAGLDINQLGGEVCIGRYRPCHAQILHYLQDYVHRNTGYSARNGYSMLGRFNWDGLALYRHESTTPTASWGDIDGNWDSHKTFQIMGARDRQEVKIKAWTPWDADGMEQSQYLPLWEYGKREYDIINSIAGGTPPQGGSTSDIRFYRGYGSTMFTPSDMGNTFFLGLPDLARDISNQSSTTTVEQFRAHHFLNASIRVGDDNHAVNFRIYYLATAPYVSISGLIPNFKSGSAFSSSYDITILYVRVG